MKRKIISRFLLFLLVSSTIISTTNKIIAENKIESKKLVVKENECDDLDHLIDDAINTGIVGPEIAQPSTLEVILTRASIILFLKPYIYLLTKYRLLKKKLTKTLHILFYKKKEEEEKDKSKESKSSAE